MALFAGCLRRARASGILKSISGFLLVTMKHVLRRLHAPLCSGWAAALLLAVAALGTGAAAAQPAPAAAPPGTRCPALLQHRFNRLQDEAPQDLCQYAGRVLLVVNTASFCGFTPQYEGLERLHARLAPRGLVVLGFPSNDFGQQEPGNNRQIADFCFNTYAVKFPMFSKTTVVGRDAHPLYVALARASGSPPAWNFHKYLVDRKGRVLASFPSGVNPEAPELVARIERALAER
jgi:glutathione peroxidase